MENLSLLAVFVINIVKKKVEFVFQFALNIIVIHRRIYKYFSSGNIEFEFSVDL